MLILYHKPTCPFCQRVAATINRLGLEVEWRDITADPEHAAELEARGGKRQVPYLIDEGKGVEMYESDSIIAHLETHYGQHDASAAKP
jgi:glutathione S-transferase